MSSSQSQNSSKGYFCSITLAALGVVYGDIGTSPLYALRECFSGHHPMPPTRENILGILSLILWSLNVIVSFKYLTLVMKADNKGEGGILALLALAVPKANAAGGRPGFLLGMGVFGAALLYGDGIITPAVTVLGAIEGLEVVTSSFKPVLLPLSVAVLVALFLFQHRGSGRVGRIFGPVMIVWFLTLALLGLKGIFEAPEVFQAINPWHAVSFLADHGYTGFLVLGSVFLAVTGAEALYADMGHFGVKPIRFAWIYLVLPALILNYLGQGALLLKRPEAITNPFYLLAPSWALYPLVALSTLAAVIASQALITGAFSITVQAMQLGYLPRMQIQHTSSTERGQIYLPFINWTLLVACLALVLGFGSSSALAAAYGIAVTLTMAITTLLFFRAAKNLWSWKTWPLTLICALFLILELAFFGANLAKFVHGGWVPIVVGVVVYTLMSTWRIGRHLLRESLEQSSLPLDLFLEDLKTADVHRVPGTAVFMAGNLEGTPIALLHNLKHNKVLHARTIILTIVNESIPHVDAENRVRIEDLAGEMQRIVARFGFMEEPTIDTVLAACRDKGLEIEPEQTTFFLSRETVIPSNRPGMALWRDRLFALMGRNAHRATSFFKLPPNRVVELGMQVEI